MPDAYDVFRNAPERKREMLKTLWKELHEALGGDAPAATEAEPTKYFCVLGSHQGPQREAVARYFRCGHTVCQPCIERHDLKDLWPLDLKLNRDPKVRPPWR